MAQRCHAQPPQAIALAISPRGSPDRTAGGPHTRTHGNDPVHDLRAERMAWPDAASKSAPADLAGAPWSHPGEHRWQARALPAHGGVSAGCTHFATGGSCAPMARVRSSSPSLSYPDPGFGGIRGPLPARPFMAGRGGGWIAAMPVRGDCRRVGRGRRGPAAHKARRGRAGVGGH